MDRLGADAERELDVHAVDPRHPRVADDLDPSVAGDELAEPLQRAELHVNAARGQDGAVEIARARIGRVVVERPPLLVQRPERRLVLRQRALAADAAPCLLGVDLDQDRHGPPAQRRPDLVGSDGAATERDHGRAVRVEGLANVLRLPQPERRLATGLEDPRDRLLPLDLAIDVDERAAELLGECRAERGLAGTHEADQSDVTV